MSLLHVSNVKKSFGANNVLNGINFDVQQGEFVGIMGPSGAGKSTLLHVISTIDKPTSGKIEISGEDITQLKRKELADFRREKLGFIFQDFNLLDTMTVKENMILPLVLLRQKQEIIDREANAMAAILGLENLLDKYPHQISGGQAQRTAAARAMITRPKMILADEPTGSLDSKSSRDLLQCMANLNEQNNATILMVTHDVFAASFCKRILFIKDGNLFSQLISTGNRKKFFNKIIDVLAAMGGDIGDLR